MTQDRQEEKTFASATSTASMAEATWRTGLTRTWPGLAGLAALVVGAVVAVWLLSPERQHLLFDLALAILAVIAAFWLLARGVRNSADKPHAELLAVTMGVSTAGAVLGLLLFTLHGRTVGWTQTPALVVGFLLVMIVGGMIGGLLGAFFYWPANLAGSLTGLDLKGIGLIAGGLSGLAMGVVLMLTRDARFSLQAAAVLLGMVCGYRGALLHERLAARRGRR